MQKLPTVFSKNISVYAIFSDQIFNDTLINDVVSFEQLGQVTSLISPDQWPMWHPLKVWILNVYTCEYDVLLRRETTFVTLFVFQHMRPFWEGVYVKKKAFAPKRISVLTELPFLNVCQFLLTFATVWANSADDRLMMFFLFFPENRIWCFVQMFSVSKPVS